MTIPELIFTNTEHLRDKIALVSLYKEKFHGITFGELRAHAESFAAFLTTRGVKKGDTVAIFSENRPEWAIADLGIQLLGAITIPIHSVFQPKYIKHVIDDSAAQVLVVSDKHLFEKLKKTHEETALHTLIYCSHNKLLGVDEKKFFYFTECLHKFATPPPLPFKINDDDIATIVYTSGTTGLPKGAVLTHRNIVSNMEASARAIPITSRDRFLSFLPLSHIFERTGGYYTPLYCGASVYYAQDVQSLLIDLKKVHPTILVAVPRVFEKAYERIQQKKSFKKIASKPFGNRLLSYLIKKRFGGKLRLCVSGGAALDPHIAEFFHTYHIMILEGYGLTETSPVISCNRIDTYKFGTCGLPLDNVSVTLAPDHEILVKGPSVMKGYHNLPDKTREVFTPDGYFKTGDFGDIDAQGFITITGRKKNILILSTGKNVQPETIESALNASPYIEQVIAIGEGKKMMTALIVPEREYFKSLGITETHDMYPIIQQEIDRLLADVPEHEKIKRFHLLEKPFSLENDELTPTLKVKRRIIAENYKEQIAALYQ